MPLSSVQRSSSVQPLIQSANQAQNHSYLESLLSMIRDLGEYLGLLSPKVVLTPEQRKYRVRLNPSDVQARLDKEMKQAQSQMRSETEKTFRYVHAKKDLKMSAHQHKVGNYEVGICHAQGRRPTMEDEHIDTSFSVEIGGKTYSGEMFGVFDGHGGREAARYVKAHLKDKLQEQLKKFNTTELTDVGIWNALKLTFVELNEDFKNHYDTEISLLTRIANILTFNFDVISDKHGTTASVAIMLDGKVWTANVGDSRTMLDNNGTAIQLTQDASPEDPRYTKGIETRGGEVINVFGVARINGILAVGRALGDWVLKGAANARPKITAIDIKKIKPGSQIIITCDGITDVARTVDVVKAVHDHKQESVKTLAENIVYSAHKAGSGDNLSALVIRFSGTTQETDSYVTSIWDKFFG